ncbi:MAG TPA: PEP-CTERM sorting domain-containing protein [Tepidisphaeraceae bacterium]|nr:PEP-CTERM sorting domain-containing protein [Tepidisphaeraceae bacterium]
MSKTKAIVLAAIAGLGLSTSAEAAAIVGRLSLFSADATPIPQVGGVYQLEEGQTFKVQFEIQVTDPNTLRTTGRTAAQQAGKPLGAETVNAQILTSANNVLVPKGDNNSPKHWTNDGGDFIDATPDGLGFPFATLNPLGDSDLDVDGAGFVNTNFTVASASGLNGKQYGVGDFTAISIGDYIATGVGTTSLSTLINSAKVYADTASGTGVQAVDPTGVTNASLQINVTPIPEPASLGLLALGGLALGRRRRA